MAKRVVLIGHPVVHSLSGALQQAAFDELGIDATYEPLDTPLDRPAGRVAALRGDDYLGANITVPYKERVVPDGRPPTEEAQRTGAVDTITREGARLVGHNTDVPRLPPGARRAGRQARRCPRRRSCWAPAAAPAPRSTSLITAGFQHVVVFNRHLHRAEGLVRHFARSAAHMELRAKPWHESVLEAELAKTKVLINASSVGRDPDESPIPAELLPPELLVLDLLYVPQRDAAAARCARRPARRRTLNGDLMLLHQSAAAFQLWTGQEAPWTCSASAGVGRATSAERARVRDASEETARRDAAARPATATHERRSGAPERRRLAHRGRAARRDAGSCRDVRAGGSHARQPRVGQGRPLAGHGRRPGRTGAREPGPRRRLPADALMGEEDAPTPRATPGSPPTVVERGRRARDRASTAGEVVEALDALRRSGRARPALVDARPGGWHEGLPAQRAVRGRAGARRGRRGRAGVPRLPQPADAATGAVGCLFVAERGRGRPAAAARRSAAEAARIAVSSPVTDGARRATPNRSRQATRPVRDRADRCRGWALTAPPLRLDSQAKYAVVARGDASIYLRLPHGDYRENVWDHAAGSLIVEEAGGRVSRRGRAAARLHAGTTTERQPGHRGHGSGSPRCGAGRSARGAGHGSVGRIQASVPRHSPTDRCTGDTKGLSGRRSTVDWRAWTTS